MKYKNLMVAILAVVALSACGKDSDGNNSNETGTYQYTVNGCDTGSHSYNSKSEFCSLLKNDSANNDCAYSVRQTEFQNNGCN